MPPLAVLRSREGRTDRNGEGIGTEVWYVNLRPGGAAKEFLALDKGILEGTPWPDDSALICDAINDTMESDGIGTVLTAQYSVSGRYLFLRNVREITFLRYTKSWQKVQRLIPIARKITYRGEKPGIEPVEAWVPAKWPAGEEKQEIVEVEVAFKVKNNQFATINRIGDQVNKIHKFSSMGTHYRFEAAPVQHVGPEDFTCKYSWIGDNGTPVTDSMVEAQADSDNRLFFPFPILSSDPYLRKPHYEFTDPIPARDPTRDVPKFPQASIYDFTDLDGWRTLPGLPGTL